MSNVTKPIILDETGQAIKAAIKEGATIVADKIKGGSKRSGLVYGFHINADESDPSAAVTYLNDAVGMTPARMNFLSNKFSYGSWADAFFMPRPCMLKYDGTVDYYLDPNDYEKKENGEVSALGDSTMEYGVKYPGNAMMEWGRNNQQIWTKCLPDGDDVNSGSVFISNQKIDESYTAWPFINNQGVLTTHFYTAIYNGSITAYTSDGTKYRLRSIPRRPVMNSPGNNSYDIPWDDDTADPVTNLGSTLTQAGHEVRLALNNNPGVDLAFSDTYPTFNGDSPTVARSSIYWFTEVFCDIQLINNLLVLIGKTLNTQDAFGNGNMNGNGASGYLNNGVLYTGSNEYIPGDPSTPNYATLNKSGLFWGSSSNKQAVKTFGMENWWGNQYRRYAGHISKNSTNVTPNDYTHWIKNTFGQDDGSSTIGYNSNGTGYVDSLCVIPTSNSYIKKSKFIDSVTYGGNTYRIATFLASDGGGSASTYYSDYFYQNRSSQPYYMRGGRSNDGYRSGAFYIVLGFNISYAGWYVGAALSYKPVS